MKIKQGILSVILSFCLLFLGCVKEDLTKLSDDISWQPNFSLPLSDITMNSGDYVGGLSFLDRYNLSNEIILSETIDFDFIDIFSQEEYVEELMFRFDVENRFPAKVEIYAYYLDEYLQIVRSMLTESPVIIPAPEVDNDGNIMKGFQVVHDEYISEDDVPLLVDVKYILVQVIIMELDQSPAVVSRIDDYDINIDIGIRAYLNIPLNE